MVFEVYCANAFKDHEHEWWQFKELHNLLKERYENDEKPVYMLVNFKVEFQIDVVILMPNQIIIIELKNHKGKIIAPENGVWYVERDKGEKDKIISGNYKNPYEQVLKQKHSFTNYLKKIRRENPSKFPKIDYIKAWVYFENESTFDERQIPEMAKIWFGVVRKDNLISKLQRGNENYKLEEEDMKTIVKSLDMEEYPTLDALSKSSIQENSGEPNRYDKKGVAINRLIKHIHKWDSNCITDRTAQDLIENDLGLVRK